MAHAGSSHIVEHFFSWSAQALVCLRCAVGCRQPAGVCLPPQQQQPTMLLRLQCPMCKPTRRCHIQRRPLLHCSSRTQLTEVQCRQCLHYLHHNRKLSLPTHPNTLAHISHSKSHMPAWSKMLLSQGFWLLFAECCYNESSQTSLTRSATCLTTPNNFKRRLWPQYTEEG